MDEKKKLIVVAVLVAVIACVGAFQFLGGSKAPAPVAPHVADKPKAAIQATDKAPAPKNPEVANELPARNPFQVPPGALPSETRLPTVPHPASLPGSIRHGMDNLKGLQPLPMSGPGDLSRFPSPMHPGVGSHPQPVIDEKPFGYKIVGIIGGVRPAVLVEDASGNQKLVPVGSAVDGDTRVRSVENDAVTFEYRGKKLRLTVGGNPGGK